MENSIMEKQDTKVSTEQMFDVEYTEFERPMSYFNLGATQDPKSTLIGNTHFKDGEGTYFSDSLFVKAIQTPNAIIMLDELSRAHPEAWNILMTVLDEGQRYLRIDDQDGSPTIKVAEGVSFIATANIGNEYTSARVIDRAMMDRFAIIEMVTLSKEDEKDLLVKMFPSVDEYDLGAIAEVSSTTRANQKSENPDLTNSVSTRVAVQTAELIEDGFTLFEAAEVTILPFFDADGGMDSERVFVKQLLQKFEKQEDSDVFNTEGEESPQVSTDNPF